MVNDKLPECNGPFLVYPVPDFLGVGGRTEYKGFYIFMPIDVRFIEMDEEVTWYSAKVVSGTQVLVQAPAWPFCFWPKGNHSSKLYDRIVSQVDDPVKKSMHNAHSIFDDAEADGATLEARKWKYYLLDFSSIKGIGELSSKVLYGDAGEQEILDFDFVNVPRTWTEDSQGNFSVTSQEDFLGFRVANVDDPGGRKVARTGTKKSKLALKRSQMMGSA